MKRINTVIGSVVKSRLMLLFLLATGCFSAVFAENKIVIDDFSIKAGEEKRIAVNLENTDEIGFVMMDMVLPEGLEYKVNSMTMETSRITNANFAISAVAQTNGVIRLMVRTTTLKPVMGNSGALFYVTLKAGADFKTVSKLRMTKVEITPFPVGTPSEHPEDVVVKVCPYVGNVSTSESSFSVRHNGTHKVSVELNNEIPVYGFQASIALPEGLSIVTADTGDEFMPGSRVGTATLQSFNKDGKRNIVIFDMTSGDVIAQKDDADKTMFTFEVQGSETLAEKSQIEIFGIKVTDASMADNSLEPVTIDVTNSFIADLTPALAVVDALQAKLDAAKKAIEETAPDVKDTEAITDAIDALQEQIDALRAAVVAAYNNETLAETSETVLEPKTAIEEGIDKLLADAADAQAAYDNDEAYERLTKQISELQALLDAAKNTIATDYSDVADQLADDIQAIQDMIDALTADVEGKHDAGELTEDSTVETAEINVAITKLLSDAALAHDKNTNGIDAVKAIIGDDANAKIYTVSGKRVPTLVRGAVNVVKYSDGTVKKFYVR